MARLLIFSDLHNDAQALQSLMNIDADYYFAAGDLVTFRHGLDEMGETGEAACGADVRDPGQS